MCLIICKGALMPQILIYKGKNGTVPAAPMYFLTRISQTPYSPKNQYVNLLNTMSGKGVGHDPLTSLWGMMFTRRHDDAKGLRF